jgi:hypothetical protein
MDPDGNIPAPNPFPVNNGQALCYVDQASYDLVLIVNGQVGKTIAYEAILASSGGGGGAVDSVFTRTGAVVAATGDYQFSQITQPFVIDTPENHGAARDGVTDDTAAIKAAINAAVTACVTNGSNYCEVWFSGGVYLASGATTQGGSTHGNAQIPLPVMSTTAEKVVLVLRGSDSADSLMHWQQTTSQAAGAVIKSTLAGTNSGTFGEASVIGGPTPLQGYGSTASLFSNMLVVIDGLTLLVPNDPHVCGFDFRGVAEAKVKTASVMPILTTGPPNTAITPATQGWQFGLSMPQTNNNDLCEIGSFTGYGQNYSCVISEHTIADAIRSIYCIAGLTVAGGAGTSTPHRCLVKYASVESCQIGLMGNYDTGSPTKVDILQFDYEGGSGSWATFHGVHDPSNNLSGTMNWGANGSGAPDVNGASGLRIINLEQARGHVASPSIPSTTVALVNPFWRDAAVTITGGTVTVIAIDGTASGLTSGTVIIPTGKVITLTYSVAPSWVWTLL